MRIGQVKGSRIDVMIEANVWVRRQAAAQGEWGMEPIEGARRYLRQAAKRYGLCAVIEETDDRVRACLILKRRRTRSVLRPGRAVLYTPDSTAYAATSVPRRDFEVDWVEILDDFVRRGAPTLEARRG